MVKNRKNDKDTERRSIDPVITWSPDYCKYCQTCIHICPVENLLFDKEDEMMSLGKCIQCQLCMKYCPDFALEVPAKDKASSGKKSEPQPEEGVS